MGIYRCKLKALIKQKAKRLKLKAYLSIINKTIK